MKTSISGVRATISAFVVLASLSLAACGGGGTETGARLNEPGFGQPAAQQLADTFGATLSGDQQVPATDSTAQGAGTVVINPSSRQMTAIVTTSGIGATNAHIARGEPGTAGQIVIPLVEEPAGSGVWTATAGLSEEQLDALRAGEFYFAMQSTRFPNGELRGQIVPQLPGMLAGTPTTGDTSGGVASGTGNAGVPTFGFGSGTAAPTTFVTALRGSQSVPPNPSTAEGSGTVTVNPATRQIAAAIIATGMAPTGAAIHTGALGTSGELAINLSETRSGSGVWLARATLSEEQFRNLVAGNLYFNVRSAAYPEGEIRGQLLPQQRGTVQNPATPIAGVPNTGVPGFGSGPIPTPGLGIDATGTGSAGIGNTIPGAPSLGNTGTIPGTPIPGPTGTIGTGAAGFGTTGAGATGIGTTGIGTTGIGTTGIGTIGTGTTGIGAVGTGNAGMGTTGMIGVTGGGIGGSINGGTGFGVGTTDLGGLGGTATGATGFGMTGLGGDLGTPGSLGRNDTLTGIPTDPFQGSSGTFGAF